MPTKRIPTARIQMQREEWNCIEWLIGYGLRALAGDATTRDSDLARHALMAAQKLATTIRMDVEKGEQTKIRQRERNRQRRLCRALARAPKAR